uniref:Uncharacterized protein n=1 Tax=Anguilla anguilla TaxID=7936 RepID=A0A0E9VNA7_ANGAN
MHIWTHTLVMTSFTLSHVAQRKCCA